MNQLTVLSRQGFGMTSGFQRDESAYLEIMLQRRMSQDDGRGLSEAVNDQNGIKITHWLLYDKLETVETVRQKYRSIILSYSNLFLKIEPFFKSNLTIVCTLKIQYGGFHYELHVL